MYAVAILILHSNLFSPVQKILPHCLLVRLPEPLVLLDIFLKETKMKYFKLLNQHEQVTHLIKVIPHFFLGF